MSFKEIDPFWRGHDTYTVHEAAALIAGFDPKSVDPSMDFFRDKETGLTDGDGITKVQIMFSALTKAINGGKLRAALRFDAEPRYCHGIDVYHQQAYWNGEDVDTAMDERGDEYVIRAIPNWEETTIDQQDLISWLKNRGFKEGFFIGPTIPSGDAEMRERLLESERERAEWKARAEAAEAAARQVETFKKQISELHAELREKGDALARLQREHDELKGETLEGRKRSTALKVIGGMMRAYNKMDIHSEKLEGIARIHLDLGREGVSIDEKTLRSLIRQAAEVLDPLPAKR